MTQKPITIRTPADRIAAYRSQANAENCTLMDWILQCCVANLPVAVQKNLSERTARAPRPTGKPKTKNPEWRLFVKAPADWLEAFEAAAKAADNSRSRWMLWCCDANLPPAVLEQLDDLKPAHRPAAS